MVNLYVMGGFIQAIGSPHKYAVHEVEMTKAKEEEERLLVVEVESESDPVCALTEKLSVGRGPLEVLH